MFLPVEPLPFQPPNGCTPGQAPVVAPARAVDVDHAGLDAVEERVDLVLLAAEEPGGQAEGGVVRLPPAPRPGCSTRCTARMGTNSSSRISW